MSPNHTLANSVSPTEESKPPPDSTTQETTPKPFSIMSIHFPRKPLLDLSSRPTLNRTPSVQTRYMNMLLALDTIPRLHNILASAFTWILLAGYVIFPGTFTSLQNSDVINDSKSKSEAESTGKEVLRHVAFLPLLWVAAVCCIIGASGMCWLWWRWSENYVWLLNRIFLPGCLNSLAGLVNTLVSVYTAQNRQWSITAKVTVCVTGSCTLVTGLLFVVYNNLVLSKVKRKHEREMQLNGTEDEHEDILHKINRKAREPALEPSSVV